MHSLDAGRCLICDHDAILAENDSCNGKQLSLASRQISPSFGQHHVQREAAAFSSLLAQWRAESHAGESFLALLIRMDAEGVKVPAKAIRTLSIVFDRTRSTGFTL